MNRVSSILLLSSLRGHFTKRLSSLLPNSQAPSPTISTRFPILGSQPFFSLSQIYLTVTHIRNLQLLFLPDSLFSFPSLFHSSSPSFSPLFLTFSLFGFSVPTP